MSIQHAPTCSCGAVPPVLPTLVSESDNWTRMLVKEMVAHKHEFERARDSREGCHELDTFWLRKSKQPVLSVLMVKKPNKGVKFFRGMNVEVSMPTGSLCSERNAIGSALSSDPSLCRKDLRMIAVLALGLEPFSTTSTLSASLPVPKQLIPLAPTTPHASNMSPMKGAFSPRLQNYPKLAAYGINIVTANATDVQAAIDESMLPQTAGNPAFKRAQSERSLFQQQQEQKGASAAAAAAGTAPPPSSPLVKAESGSTTNTPRKRKAANGTAGAQLTVPNGAESVASQSPSPPAPAVSPRFTRHSTVPNGSAAAAASQSPSPQPPSPSATPLSPQTRTRSSTRGSNGAAKVEESDALSTAQKRQKRVVEAAVINGGCESVYASGEVDEAMQAAYVAHELALVAARDAVLRSRHANSHAAAAQMSGNAAPNAVTPVDRCDSASPPAPLQLTHSASSASSHSVVDERNPINPCGACNEWLLKIAQANPDFRVITFTSTDCSTCYIKPVA